MNFGGELEGYKARYVKYSDKEEEHGFEEGDKYFGEWSVESNQTYGRYILISKDGSIDLGYQFDQDDSKVGNFILLRADSSFFVE